MSTERRIIHVAKDEHGARFRAIYLGCLPGMTGRPSAEVSDAIRAGLDREGIPYRDEEVAPESIGEGRSCYPPLGLLIAPPVPATPEEAVERAA